MHCNAQLHIVNDAFLPESWHNLRADQFFPDQLSVRDDTPAWVRQGIDESSECDDRALEPAFTEAARTYGCRAIVRATYIDATGTLVATIAVIVLDAGVESLHAEFDPAVEDTGQLVHAYPVPDTPAAGWTDEKRGGMAIDPVAFAGAAPGARARPRRRSRQAYQRGKWGAAGADALPRPTQPVSRCGFAPPRLSQWHAARVRGMGDRLTVGERVAFYRGRRGLTQTELANLVGRGPDWLSKIERGERRLRNIEILAELARALRVTLGDLLGQPVLLEDDKELDDVPAVRDALMAPARLSRVIYQPRAHDGAINPTRAAQLVDFAWTDYQRGRLSSVISQLPSLIRSAQRLEDAASALPQAERRKAWAVSARTHHLAATALSKVGEADLSWIAAERAMAAADQSNDVLVLASTARAAAHASALRSARPRGRLVGGRSGIAR
jgi:transcriptional regulator with XRE-family HTH domain